MVIVEAGGGGDVVDISVGGDCLFVLHKDEDVFEVWETPNNTLRTRN